MKDSANDLVFMNIPCLVSFGYILIDFHCIVPTISFGYLVIWQPVGLHLTAMHTTHFLSVSVHRPSPPDNRPDALQAQPKVYQSRLACSGEETISQGHLNNDEAIGGHTEVTQSQRLKYRTAKHP